MDTQKGTRKEEINISGDDLVAKIKELIHEGNVRKVSIRNEDGKTLMELPLNAGGAVAAAAVFFAPALAAAGAIAAIVAKLTLVIERTDDQTASQPPADAVTPEDTSETHL